MTNASKGSTRGFTGRGFLGCLATAGAALTGCSKASRPIGTLPGQQKFIIRNASVMTMDDALGDIAGGDVRVKNGEIVAFDTVRKRANWL